MKHLVPILATTAWLLVLGAGIGYLMSFDTRPGDGGHVVEYRAEPTAELVLFLHPKCPCAKSALQVLAHIDSTFGRVRIVFVGPTDAGEEWWAGRNWDLASAIPCAILERDPGGQIAVCYGVRTSGHAVLYAANGRLRFSGGVAPTRSTVPDSTRQFAEWQQLLQEPDSQSISRPVFGCPLFDDAAGD